VGIISALISRVLKASPFPSESLDKLAEIMQVTKVLKINKLDRYYKVRLRVGGMAFLGRSFLMPTISKCFFLMRCSLLERMSSLTSLRDIFQSDAGG
jgi:hypothetical protein